MLRLVDSSSLVVVAAVFLAYAALSRRLRGTSITAAIVFVAAGFLFGSEGLGWLHITLGQDAVSTLAEATLVVVLFSDASRIDPRALRREYAVPARLLGIGLPLTIVAGTLAGGLVLHGVTWAEALVLAERAGVATSTVSRAFSQPGRVSADTRDRVLAVAAELK